MYSGSADGAPLMHAGKPLAILAYVGLAPNRGTGRDQLAELLWPGSDLSASRHSLRQSLYRLKQVAGGRALVQARGGRLEAAPGVRFDCLEGEDAVGRGELEAACALLRGNFLEGFAIPESREFESWAESQRTRFRELYARAASALAQRGLAEGEAERALELAEEVAALHALSDEAVLLVMRALAELGRHATALARYHAYAELLRSELEEEPGDELQAFAVELQGYLRVRPEPSASALPFSGRAAEWSILESAWSAAQESQSAAVLIEGAAGLGKTRVIQELVGRVTGAGGHKLLAKCYEIERAVPYAAIAEALACAADSPALGNLGPAWLAEAARLLPELRERFPELPELEQRGGSPAAKRRLHQAIVRYVEALSHETPVLLAVDDAHWADAPSLETLHFLVHHLDRSRLLLAATYRPAELSPVARQFARSLCSARLARLVTLGPLAVEDVSDLIRRMGRFEDAAVGHVVAEHLHRHSGGSPLFLSEMLESLARDRVLSLSDGTWRLARKAHIEELPRTLGKLLADRIDALDTWMRAFVETLAVAGDEISIEALALTLQVSEPRAALALAVLQEERLARRSATGGFELIHDELRRLVYHGIPDERRRLLHGALGQALESLGEAKRPGGPARLAHHFDQAGDLERAHRFALSAAGEAGALGANEAQRSHLEVAAAHAPRALPPRATATRPGWRALLQSRPAKLAAAGIVLLAAVGAMASQYLRPTLWDPLGLADYRQGRLYLTKPDAASPTHALRWPTAVSDTAELATLDTYPWELPPRVIARWVTEAAETHLKLFRVTGRDTVQITYGRTDDYPDGWSPDGRYLAVRRGWKEGALFRSNLFLLDSLGRVVRRVTDTWYQERPAAWSPTGTRLAFGRDSLGQNSIWIADPDGAHTQNISRRFGLPANQAGVGFSPDGRRLALVYPDAGSGSSALYLLDLAIGTVRAQPAPPEPPANLNPVWSPDGRWLAYVAQSGDERILRIRSVGEPHNDHAVSRLPTGFRLGSWTDERPRYAAEVSVETEHLELGTGYGQRVSSRVRSPRGEPVAAPVRWSVSDTRIAAVDPLGFVRGRSPGSTELVASAGGLLADTASLTVTAAHVDTLLVEDWTGGLDTTRWLPLGFPKPIVVFDAPDGRPAFFNNGDYNHHSTAASKRRFDPSPNGLTVEVEAWVSFTGDEWQTWFFGVLTNSDHEIANRAPEAPAPHAAIALDGPDPIGVGHLAAEVRGGRNVRRVLDIDRFNHRWHRFAIQLRPDSVAEFFHNGELLGQARFPPELWGGRFTIQFGGYSVGTRLYHGPVVVTRGLRY